MVRVNDSWITEEGDSVELLAGDVVELVCLQHPTVRQDSGWYAATCSESRKGRLVAQMWRFVPQSACVGMLSPSEQAKSFFPRTPLAEFAEMAPPLSCSDCSSDVEPSPQPKHQPEHEPKHETTHAPTPEPNHHVSDDEADDAGTQLADAFADDLEEEDASYDILGPKAKKAKTCAKRKVEADAAFRHTPTLEQTQRFDVVSLKLDSVPDLRREAEPLPLLPIGAEGLAWW